jgi:hypothetical protein
MRGIASSTVDSAVARLEPGEEQELRSARQGIRGSCAVGVEVGQVDAIGNDFPAGLKYRDIA